MKGKDMKFDVDVGRKRIVVRSGKRVSVRPTPSPCAAALLLEMRFGAVPEDRCEEGWIAALGYAGAEAGRECGAASLEDLVRSVCRNFGDGAERALSQMLEKGMEKAMKKGAA